jgi:hypothetical protein
VIDHDAIIHDKMYVKINNHYIVASVKERTLEQMIYPFIFFIGIVVFYLLYIKRMIMKPVMIIDDFLRGMVQKIPKFYIWEFNNLSENLQNNLKELKELAYFDTLTGVYTEKPLKRSWEKRSLNRKETKVLLQWEWLILTISKK